MAYARICDGCKKFYDHNDDDNKIIFENNEVGYLIIHTPSNAVIRNVHLCKKCFMKAFKNLYQEGEK